MCVCVFSAKPGAGHPLRLRVQLVDESQQLVEGLVLVRVDDDGVKKVTAALLHLAGLLDDVAQLLGLFTHTHINTEIIVETLPNVKSDRGTLGFLLSLASRARSLSWEGGAIKMI